LRPNLVIGNDEYNSWGMRDHPRTIAKPDGSYRILFVGDSFLEGGFCEHPLPWLSEDRYKSQSPASHVECVNLGISGTGPPQYYYRLKNVGAKLQPDAVFLFFYAGNDFVNPPEALNRKDEKITSFVAEAPRPSVFGELAPRLNWYIVNRLRLSERDRGSKGIPNEFEDVNKMTQLPFEEGTQKLAEHVHRYYRPEYPVDKIVEVLRRGGPKYWDTFKPRERDQEYWQAWIISNMLQWELGIKDYPKSVKDVSSENVEACQEPTLTWLDATKALCDRLQVPLVVFLAPVGSVDPAFAEFWKPWPSYYSYNLTQTARLAALAPKLRAKGIHVVDLTEVLQGVPNTYRLTDAHWCEKGHGIVADVVVREIARIRGERGASSNGVQK
jgi:hypothetical protein